MRFPLHVLVAVAATLSGSALAAPDARIGMLDTLDAELSRNKAQLKLEDHDAPYFISYRLRERTEHEVEARFGALLTDDAQRDRVVAVDVRVGDYRFDSSEKPEDTFLLEPLEGFRPSKKAAVEDDPVAIRAALWLLTDRAYKKALSTFLQKKARKVSTVEDKHVDSFSKETPVKHVGPARGLTADHAAWKALAKSLSGRMRHKGLLDGTVRISASHQRTWLVTSEGTRLVKDHVIYGVAVNAIGQASDGMLLEQGETLYGRSWGDLPDAKALEATVDQALANLDALAAAPVADPYTGPAILEPEATGVFFHETIGHRLEGERQNDENEGRTFKGQLKQRILPAFITVRDDPSQADFAGTPLNGHYHYDDQGVASRNVSLVKDGVLETFLTSRTPLEDVNGSNGHGRAAGTRKPMARMGNLIIEGAKSKRVSRERLKAMLLAEVRKQGKPYGLIIRDIVGGSTNTSSYGFQAFKGLPRMVFRVDAKTGKETLVRGVEMVGTPLTVISKIIAVSDEMGVFNGYCGAESGYVPVSAVAPAALFSEIELQRSQRDKERAPILSPPWAVKKGH